MIESSTGDDMADQSKKNAPTHGAAKAQHSGDAKQVARDYEAEMAAVRAKTEKLRALRLARDAAAPPPPPKAAPKKKAGANKSEKRTNATLSQWLDQQERSGRKS
jgi:hypothetical protein